MTPRELDLCFKGRRKVQLEQWEMVRSISYYSLLPHQSKKSARLRFKDINLPIDEELKNQEVEVIKPKKYSTITFLTDKYGKGVSRN